MDWKEHVVLDKDNGKVRAEVKTSDTKNSYEHSVDIELTEKDTDGHTTHHYEQSTRITASGAKVTNEDETYTYDAKTGKKLTHDEKNSYGKVLHEEYDGTTGKQKSADETDNNRRAHRTYDSSTGTIKQEDIDNADKTHETIKYNSNGDKLSREKQYEITVMKARVSGSIARERVKKSTQNGVLLTEKSQKTTSMKTVSTHQWRTNARSNNKSK